MKEAEVLSIAEYLGCNGQELWSELSKLKTIKGRDNVIKRAFIHYLERDTDERFFQALTNFTGLPYIGTANTPGGEGFKDLWHVEADKEFYPEA